MNLGRSKKGATGSSGRNGNCRTAISEFYNSKSGIATATILTLILWWVPYIGPMAAGFMGGRKGGSLLRGVFVGASACVFAIAMATAFSVGIAGLMSLAGDAILDTSQVLYDRLHDLQGYLDTLVVVNGTSISVEPSSYFLMLALSIIGGAYADQSRGEVKAIVALEKEANAPAVPRSVKAYRENRSLEFKTYEDYARMSTNVTSAPEYKDIREPAKPPGPVTASVGNDYTSVRTEDAVVIEHTQPIASTVTVTATSETVETVVPDVKSEPAPRREVKDDYEFL